MHGQSMMSVYRQIDMSLLPDEYLPDDYGGPSAGSLEDITGKLVLSLRYMCQLPHLCNILQLFMAVKSIIFR